MSELGTKISQLRKRKGYSQEKLAEDAQINLRTIQRIEKGQTFPHGDTLLRIAVALGSPIEDLLENDIIENIGYIKAMHLSALIFLVIPTGNIILPLIFWLIKKNQIRDISFYAKKLINFQITWSLFAYFPFALVMFRTLTHIEIPFPDFVKIDLWTIMYFDYLVWYPINVIYIVLVGFLIKNECKNFFPVSIRFIK